LPPGFISQVAKKRIAQSRVSPAVLANIDDQFPNSPFFQVSEGLLQKSLKGFGVLK
jgi:hypothetical protein